MPTSLADMSLCAGPTRPAPSTTPAGVDSTYDTNALSACTLGRARSRCWRRSRPGARAIQTAAAERRRPPASSFHIEGSASTCGSRPRHDRRERGLRHLRLRTIDFKSDLGLDDKRMTALEPHRCGRRAATSSASSTSRSSTKPRRSLRRDDHLQRPALSASNLPVNSTLDWKAYRFGYEFDFVDEEPRLRRLHHRGEVHRRAASSLRQPARSIASSRTRSVPDPGARRHRPLLRRAEHLDHRRGHRLQAARQHRRPLQRATTSDVDIYGTVNFTNNVGVTGRLPLARRRATWSSSDTGSFTLKGIVLRGGGALLRRCALLNTKDTKDTKAKNLNTVLPLCPSCPLC